MGLFQEAKATCKPPHPQGGFCSVCAAQQNGSMLRNGDDSPRQTEDIEERWTNGEGHWKVTRQTHQSGDQFESMKHHGRATHSMHRFFTGAADSIQQGKVRPGTSTELGRCLLCTGVGGGNIRGNPSWSGFVHSEKTQTFVLNCATVPLLCNTKKRRCHDLFHRPPFFHKKPAQ